MPGPGDETAVGPVGRSRLRAAAAALACATLALLVGVVALPPLPDGSPAELSVIAAIFVLSGILATSWFLLLHAWLEERASALRLGLVSATE